MTQAIERAADVKVRACPECRSRQLCEPDCVVAPWNIDGDAQAPAAADSD